MWLGVDLVDLERAKQVFSPDRNLSLIFTPAELEYCLPRPKPAQHLAARFAAKEAFFKALGTGVVPPMRWCEVEVRRTRTGPPELYLHGATLQRAMAVGMGRILLSLSHTKTVALAEVVVLPAVMGEGNAPAIPVG